MKARRAPRVASVGRRLAEAEATIAALLAGQIDAVVDSRSQTPVLLSKAQDALRASEERYRQIVETANEGISIVDAAARFTFVNRRFADMLGFDVEEIVGVSLFAFLPADGAAAAALRVAHSRQDISEENEVAYLRKDGSALWTLLKTTPIRGAGGEWRGTLGMTTDWTRHREDAAALQAKTARLLESEERFLQLAGASRDIFFLRDPQTTRMFYVSPAYEAIFGRSCGSLYADPGSWAAAIHPADANRVAAQLRSVPVMPRDLEYRILRPDGVERAIRSRTFPILDEAGLVYRLAGIAEDVTDRKMLEAQFRQSQRMEGIGRLAGGVAHDFNNLLTAILGFGEMTLAQLPPDGQIREDVQQIVNAGQSAASLTRQLLAFSRQQVLEPIVLDLNIQVAGMQTLLRRVIGEDIRLMSTLGDRLPRIKADRGQVEQVIMNLAVNARDAMPSGGTLRIVTESVDLDEAFVAAHPGARSGPHVRLSVIDDGTGMSPDVLSRLFEPFFTTKERGKGTGLGLATVYGIVKQSQGYIGVESVPGAGTSFVLDFPCVSLEPEVVAAADLAVQALDGTETILVVEDQQELRDVVHLTLKRHGYDVIAAADGIAAMKVLEGCQRPVHLLLTDVVMPFMSGPELFGKIATREASIRVLYTSGYTDDAIVRHGVLQPGIDLIHKPFTPNQLLGRIRDVLDRREQLATP